MQALRSFTVRTRLPPPLAPLGELAMNLRWSWDERTRDLFRWVEPTLWEVSLHDPVRLLGLVGRGRLEALVADAGFMGFMDEVHEELERYMARPRWFQNRGGSPLRAVAYFSPEFGIAEALPQYSGGLGVLAGDHLKAASGLAVPLIGVGLFYREGYFRQGLNTDGWQQERFPLLDPFSMALRLMDGVRVTVDLAGTPLHAQVWKAQVGRIPLYLLDTDIDENGPDERAVTDRLYGGGTEHRIRQEILLGMGGVRALTALGEPTQVFHTNEGHAGFLGLERIRGLVENHAMGWAEAIEAGRSGAVFTTHTPVPAGIDRFPRELMEKYFSSWTRDCGTTIDELMALGHAPGEGPGDPFNMAVMGLRLAGRANGVSRLHGDVSRKMFRHLWPGVPAEEAPIGSVTNGVHGFTWVSPEMDDLLTRALNPSWPEADAETWARIETVRDDELWRVKEQGRARLVAFVRERLAHQLRAKGGDGADLAWCSEAFDERVLTIGFARRFATYKRADLLLSQPERLEQLLLDSDRPVQFIFAGKAHPADDHGKEIIRRIAQFARRAEVRHRFSFVEDYDIAVARVLYQGSDVWLNNPRRPMEACGTSGEKAALNGALNCSILDGWWAEMYDGQNGWAISSAEGEQDLERRDAFEAESLFDILEHHIVPLFYERQGGPVPRGWARRVKHTLRVLGPQVEASRMVRDYVTTMYEPAASRAEAMSGVGWARARALASWKDGIWRAFGQVAVAQVDSDASVVELGMKRTVEAMVSLGVLTPDDVAVQALHGPVGPNDELTAPQIVTLALVGRDQPSGHYRFASSFSCERAGRYGYTVRVVPAHPDLDAPAEMGLVAWA